MKLTKESTDAIVKIELTGTEARNLYAILNFSTELNTSITNIGLEPTEVEKTSMALWRLLRDADLCV